MTNNRTRGWKSALSQFVLNRTLRASGRISNAMWLHLRSIATSLTDAPVRYDPGTGELDLPASHPLPLYQKNFPNYDRALPRIARLLRSRKDEIVIADIGANVGDTSAALLSIPGIFVIAIEGNPKFLPFLHTNTSKFGNRVFICEKFVGSPGDAAFSLVTREGTARLVADKNGSVDAIISLASAVQAAGKKHLDLLKIDTDGFDINILNSSRDYIATQTDVLFFEFDPHLFYSISPDGWNVFENLSAIGYRHYVCYTNTGSFFKAFGSADKIGVELRIALRDRNSLAYVDIAAFKDSDVYSEFLRSESAHFAVQGAP
ncbi:FkbM family methyltransferase [Parablastomonas sp. CN1-191]|uniref:FkbM family methyltransferase n=1 Tax=Parablastomonas sp. CN1-191 TaxID=3400908 RepID=UPI003BF79645